MRITGMGRRSTAALDCAAGPHRTASAASTPWDTTEPTRPCAEMHGKVQSTGTWSSARRGGGWDGGGLLRLPAVILTPAVVVTRLHKSAQQGHLNEVAVQTHGGADAGPARGDTGQDNATSGSPRKATGPPHDCSGTGAGGARGPTGEAPHSLIAVWHRWCRLSRPVGLVMSPQTRTPRAERTRAAGPGCTPDGRAVGRGRVPEHSHSSPGLEAPPPGNLLPLPRRAMSVRACEPRGQSRAPTPERLGPTSHGLHEQPRYLEGSWGAQSASPPWGPAGDDPVAMLQPR